MIFSIDRLQYSVTQDKYYLYEFIIVNNIDNLINDLNSSSNNFWGDLYLEINNVEIEKVQFIANLENEINKYIIIYQKGINDRIIKLKYESPTYTSYFEIISFDELSMWFRDLNAVDGAVQSKRLGSVRQTNQDMYTNNIIKNLYNLETYNDDCGLELTKIMIKDDNTRGFDIDLFQYIPSTNEYIFYEFLKRENKYINNVQAHPMRYCWIDRNNDNKMKFISLWRAKNYFKGKLYLINYSDDRNEKISICEVLDMDEERGILAENKYCMSQNVFISWLKDMNVYNREHNQYLSDFKYINYGNDFFNNWQNNKRNYGCEFII